VQKYGDFATPETPIFDAYGITHQNRVGMLRMWFSTAQVVGPLSVL
jgi:hypothetical protein